MVAAGSSRCSRPAPIRSKLQQQKETTSAPVPRRSEELSSALRIVVEHGRVLDQDVVARVLVRRPYQQEVEQHPIVGLLLSLTWVWPVAAPNEALGCGLDI